MHNFEIKEELDRILTKLFKKDRNLYEQVMKKIEDIAESDDVEHFKNLKYDMKSYKRVHVGHFVLIFSYDKSKDMITFWNFDHHDNVY